MDCLLEGKRSRQGGEANRLVAEGLRVDELATAMDSLQTATRG